MKTKKKKKKKKKKKAKVKFEFTSSEQNTTFECKLDKHDFAPCSSPFTKKVKAKKHTFEVEATDAAGNTDPTAVSYKFKVKRKK